MQKRSIRISYSISAILILSGLLVLTQKQGETEWQYLFDGKTLNGWEQLNGQASYKVMDSAIVGTTVPGSPNSFLCTTQSYGNFILELDFKVDEGLNSGIQIRSQSRKDYKNGRVHGYQVEIDPARRTLYSKNPPNRHKDGIIIPAGTEPRSWTGGIYDEARRGWLCDLTHNEAARQAFRPGKWNRLRIEAIGDAIRTWINGVSAARIVDSMTPNGFIGLQVHASEETKPMQIRWKNIRLLDLGFNDAKPQLSTDPFMGDWQTADGAYVAQIFPIRDGNYRANLLNEFGIRERPIAILTGTTTVEDDEKILNLNGNGWTARVKNRCFKGHRNNEEFVMRRFARLSPTLDTPPPDNAVILFDGTDLDEWASQRYKEWLKSDGPADDWKVIPGGRMQVVPGAGSIITKREFSDFQLHLEFRLLGEPTNSGVYLLARYEINIKDSYGQIDGQPCGALGNVAEPDLSKTPPPNVTLPPYQWQTFDIKFHAPCFEKDGRQKIKNACISLDFNGIPIYKNVEIQKLRGAATRLGEASSGPIMLQEHGTALQFRNIWIVEYSNNNPDKKGSIGRSKAPN